ncbi:hypothetical protein HELRODRAFT_148304, partial [Helobdella robusta]|uniref:HMG box domain-containing protein n=1 Tax=Helobdella robusta TaxID=6412 RepID=T1EK69_HELRO
IKRPLNAFMLYLQDKREDLRIIYSNPATLHSMVGQCWRMETPEVKKKYQRKSEIEKEIHKKMNPNYKFQPKRK